MEKRRLARIRILVEHFNAKVKGFKMWRIGIGIVVNGLDYEWH